MKTAETITFVIYIAGDYQQALNLLQKYVLNGECLSCKPVDYVFTHGREAGIEVTVINYPRFPRDYDTLFQVAKDVATCLLDGLSQGSYTIVGPVESYFYDRRKNA